MRVRSTINGMQCIESVYLFEAVVTSRIYESPWWNFPGASLIFTGSIFSILQSSMPGAAPAPLNAGSAALMMITFGMQSENMASFYIEIILPIFPTNLDAILVNVMVALVGLKILKKYLGS